MDETAVKTTIAATYTVLSTFIGDLFKQVLGLLIVFVIFMLADWVTGLTSAKMANDVSSEKGWEGLMKKGCYILVILVAFGLDYVITFAAGKIGAISFSSVYVTILVTLWLIVNEGISILENLGEIGVKYPKFMTKIFGTLKSTVENQVKTGEDKTE